MISIVVGCKETKIITNNKEEFTEIFNEMIKMNEGKLYDVYCDNKRILSGPMRLEDLETILDFID